MFLSEIIHDVPTETSWIISSDSWQGIIKLLKPLGCQEFDSEWIIQINDSNRMNIRSIIEQNDLGNKIVHTHLIDKKGVKLFYALDAMSMIVVNKNYDTRKTLSKKFLDLEVYYE